MSSHLNSCSLLDKFRTVLRELKASYGAVREEGAGIPYLKSSSPFWVGMAGVVVLRIGLCTAGLL